MNYAQIKKLDEETLEKLTEGTGPSDKCLCSLFAPPDGESPKGIRASIKRAFGSLGGMRKGGGGAGGARTRGGGGVTVPGAAGQRSVEIPLTFTKGGKGIYTTKEAVQRKTSCGKCGCDSEKVVLKHSYANIRITTPDVSSICPCPSNCLPDKDKYTNNIKVTVEQVSVIDVDSVDSEFSIYEDKDQNSISEPEMERRSISELMEDVMRHGDSDWSSGEDME